MTQQQADKIFQSDLGRQLDKFYSTSDDRVFVRREEAYKHALGMLDEGTLELDDKTITTWYPDDEPEFAAI